MIMAAHRQMLMIIDGDAAICVPTIDSARQRVPWAGLPAYLRAARLERPMPGFPVVG
jgi:hypothetical protein